MDSPLIWAGAKRWQVPQITDLFNLMGPNRRLVEPFCGGLSIALGLEPRRALLNDANAHLINFWQTLQRGVPLLSSSLDPLEYYKHRTLLNELTARGIYNTTAASVFYALNQWAFNGLWRVNSRGEFNVPPRSSLRWLRPWDSRPYANVMRKWEFVCGDFESLALDETDFVYADPPYDDGFDGYREGGFSWGDQIRLAVWLSAHPGPVVAMNKATERVQRLYASLGFNLELIESAQRMHQSRGRTDKILEVMATKLPLTVALR